MYELKTGDALDKLKEIESDSIQCCVTSPPYFNLRDYGVDGQIGLEANPDAYIAKLVEVFSEVRRALKNDGTLWVNIGDSYYSKTKVNRNGKGASRLRDGNVSPEEPYMRETTTKITLPYVEGLKPKDLIGIPWMLAFALRASGWWLRQDIIWEKLNVMPASVKDRCTTSHEYMFLLSKSQRYYFDYEAIMEDAIYQEKRIGRVGSYQNNAMKTGVGGKVSVAQRDLTKRRKRSVWSINTRPYKGAHFAVFPPALIKPCLLAGSREGDTILDPFAGSGTVGVVCKKLGRNFIGIELNPSYVALAEKRIEEGK